MNTTGMRIVTALLILTRCSLLMTSIGIPMISKEKPTTLWMTQSMRRTRSMKERDGESVPTETRMMTACSIVSFSFSMTRRTPWSTLWTQMKC